MTTEEVEQQRREKFRAAGIPDGWYPHIDGALYHELGPKGFNIQVEGYDHEFRGPGHDLEEKRQVSCIQIGMSETSLKAKTLAGACCEALLVVEVYLDVLREDLRKIIKDGYGG